MKYRDSKRQRATSSSAAASVTKESSTSKPGEQSGSSIFVIDSTKRSQNLGNEAHPSKFDADELKIRDQHMKNFLNEQKEFEEDEESKEAEK